ncbi:MAG: FAD-dependent oxidoreductase, partial [Bacteroidota bacterium]
PGNDTNFPNGRIIEGGAELIGANHLLWLYYAKKFSLGLATLTGETDYAQAGLAIETDLGITVDEGFEEDLAKVYNAFANDADTYITDPYNPWTAQVPYATVQEAINKYATNSSVADFLDFELQNNNVTAIDQQSYLGLLIAIKAHALNGLNYFDDHETFRCASGNQSLAMAFSEGQSPGITFSAEVTAIALIGADNQTTVPQVSVTVSGQQPVSYDEVVLAVPATAYPSITVTGLPGGNTLSDYQVSSGRAVKFLTAVTDRFWLANNQAPTGAFSTLGMVWENTDQQYEQAFTSGTGSVNQYGLSVFAGGPTADSLVDLAKQGSDAVTTALGDKFPVATGSSDTGFGDSNVWTQQEFWEDQGNSIGYSCPVNDGSGDEASSVWANIAGLNRDFTNGLFLAGENTSPG